MASHFENMTFLFTGKLKSMKREEAEAKVEALGGKCVSSVSKNLAVLVATSETSAKTKAQELNSNGAKIQLWTEEQFLAELEKASANGNDKAKAKDSGNAKAESHSKAGAKCSKGTESSKFEAMRPFIIEIETLKNNVKVNYELNSENCAEDDIEYEALCSDSDKGEYKSFKGDFSHTFKQAGKYKISFRGNLPGLLLIDKEDKYHLLDVYQWGDICWLNMDRMFGYRIFKDGVCKSSYKCEHFNISADDQPDLSRVKSLSEMFSGAKKMNAPLENWDVSNVTDMRAMFYGAKSFNQPLESWDVSNVTDMREMFNCAESFNQPLENWNVSNVKWMNYMFSNATSFNQPLENWDVSNVVNMSHMFSYALSFNQPLESWDVSNVTDMSAMFNCAHAFNQPLEKWDVSKVWNMDKVFNAALSFNQPLEQWNVSNVVNMRYMFFGAKSFNQPLEKWDVSKVWNMEHMFAGAVSFNQSLEKWDTSKVTNNKYMLWDTPMDKRTSKGKDKAKANGGKDKAKANDRVMKYTVNVYGKCREYILGSIPKEKWDYIHDNDYDDDDEAESYWDNVENGEIPEEYVLADLVWECDDIYHTDEFYLDQAHIEVEDENKKVVFQFDCKKNNKGSEVQRKQCVKKVGKGIPYISSCVFGAKGGGTYGNIEDNSFDPKKLKLLCDVVYYESANEAEDQFIDGPVISGFEYDGKPLAFLDSDHTGTYSEKEFIDYSAMVNTDNDEERRILELVKKHLAKAAPKPMVAINILEKLKKDGIPDTQSSRTLVFDLLNRWVKRGIIVRVERGVYALADSAKKK